MLKKIRQKLADIKNKLIPRKKISEEISSDENEPAKSASANAVDKLLQEYRTTTATDDKTGDVIVPIDLTAEESATTQGPPAEIPAPPSEATLSSPPEIPVETNVASTDESDKTPTPRFDTIPTQKTPRFDTLPVNDNETSDEASADPNTIDLDSSRPLYRIPKKSRFPFLTTPLQKVQDLFAPLMKKVLSKIKKDRPDLFQAGGTGGGAKLNLNKVYEIIFSPESRPHIHRGFLALLLLCSCYALGKTLALLLKGKETAPTARARMIDLAPLNEVLDLNPIRTANLFNAHDITDIKKNRSQENVPCTLAEASSSSSLPIKVLNTIVLQDSVKSIAAVQLRSRPTLVEFREGEKIDNIAKLDRIDRLKIIIRNLDTNQCEYVANNIEGVRGAGIQLMTPAQAKTFTAAAKNPDITNEGNSFKIKKRFINERLKDIGLVLTQAKAVKITNPDGTLAFKMTEVDPGGPFASLNILVDDTITEVNGKKITSMNEVMDLFGRIKDMDKLSIGVIREGEAQTLDYNFTN